MEKMEQQSTIIQTKFGNVECQDIQISFYNDGDFDDTGVEFKFEDGTKRFTPYLSVSNFENIGSESVVAQIESLYQQ